jgi:aerobic-type carbon monoxide dehydrogenase small subunit (CoxS/CutS family)
MGDDVDATTVHFTLNGAETSVGVRPDETMLETLREALEVRSVRGACGIGVCGTCTVLLDGRPASSCLLLSRQVAGRTVVTSEGLVGDEGRLDAVQDAFVRNGAYQCSFCIPAMVLTVRAYLDHHEDRDVERAREFLGGNLCRCGSYPQVLDAVRELVNPRATGEGRDHG